MFFTEIIYGYTVSLRTGRLSLTRLLPDKQAAGFQTSKKYPSASTLWHHRLTDWSLPSVPKRDTVQDRHGLIWQASRRPSDIDPVA
jgi:hypothetical protein